MQGIYVNGRRPTSKRAVREALASDPANVRAEATSMHGGEYGGTMATSVAPVGTVVHFVGPDPYTSRRFYGTATLRPGTRTEPARWVVK